MYTCICVYVCVYIYIYIHTHTYISEVKDFRRLPEFGGKRCADIIIRNNNNAIQ